MYNPQSTIDISTTTNAKPEAYSIVRRGSIHVKGKGGMVTYFVDKRQQQQNQDQKDFAGRNSAATNAANARPSNDT